MLARRFAIVSFASLMTAASAAAKVNREATIGPDVFVLAKDSTDAMLLYAGTTQGVFISRDGGSSWTLSAARNSITALATAPGIAGTVYAGTAANIVLRSRDGGASWSSSQVPSGDFVWALVVDPQGVVYAVTFNLFGLGAELWRSVDDGDTWTRGETGIRKLGVSDLLVVAASGHVFAATGTGIFRTDDRGLTWLRISDFQARELHSDGAGTIHARDAAGGIAISVDGVSWSEFGSGASLPSPANKIAVSADGSTIWAASDTALFVWSGPAGWVDTRAPFAPSGIRDLLALTDSSVLAAGGLGLFRSAPGVGWVELDLGQTRSPRLVAPR